MGEFKDEAKFCTPVFTLGSQALEPPPEFLHRSAGCHIPEEILANDIVWRESGQSGFTSVVRSDRAIARQLNRSERKGVKQFGRQM